MIDDGTLTTGLENYKEFWQAMVALAGESQNFDGNGGYTRFQAGGGGYPVQTPARRARGGPLYANATAAPLGTRPAKTPEAAVQAERDVPHATAAEPERRARSGAGP